MQEMLNALRILSLELTILQLLALPAAMQRGYMDSMKLI